MLSTVGLLYTTPQNKQETNTMNSNKTKQFLLLLLAVLAAASVYAHGGGEEEHGHEELHLECEEEDNTTFPMTLFNASDLREQCEELCELEEEEEGLTEDWRDNLGIAWGLVVAAALSTSIGASLVFCGKFVKRGNDLALSGALGFAAGVMLFISLASIFPESLEHFIDCECLGEYEEEHHDDEDHHDRRRLHGESEPGSGVAMIMATLCFSLGILLMVVVDALVHKLEKTEPKQTSPEKTEASDIVYGSSSESSTLHKTGWKVALAVALHNFPEGLATFVATLVDPTFGAGIAIAVALHNIPEGCCVSFPLFYASKSRIYAFLVASASGLAEILGGLIGFIIVSATDSDEDAENDALFAALFGVTAGIMVAISVTELLPAAFRHDPEDKVTSKCVFLGMIVMALSIALFSL